MTSAALLAASDLDARHLGARWARLSITIPEPGHSPNGTVAGRTGRSALAGQDDAAAPGLRVQHGPDGWVAAEAIGQGPEHGQVGSADQLTVLGGDAVERAVIADDLQHAGQAAFVRGVLQRRQA